MGLTREQILERSKKKLCDYIETHGTEVKGSKIVKKIWDKYPICVMDICVLHAMVTKDGDLLFTDYDASTDTYEKDFCRTGNQLDREYIDLIYKQLQDYDLKHE